MNKSVMTAAAFAAIASCQTAAAAGKIDRVTVGASQVGTGAEAAQVDVILGPRGSAAESAFCNALVNNKDGFTTQLVIVRPAPTVKLVAALYNKVAVQDSKEAARLSGPAQRGVAQAIADSLFDGTIPVPEAPDLFISVGVFIDHHAEDDAKIQDFNYRATREAIRRAVNNY